MLSLQPSLKITLFRRYTQNVEFFLKLQNEIFLQDCLQDAVISMQNCIIKC